MQKFSFLFLLFLLAACQSPRVSGNNYAADPEMNDLALYALSLDGTPYKYGGSSPETGFDCSGFVGHVFRQSAGINLPRSSEEISRFGKKLETDELKPGDLVFFNTMNRRYSHVGIYLGDGQFIHSPSTGKSVTVVNMNDKYYRQRYNGARRVKP